MTHFLTGSLLHTTGSVKGSVFFFAAAIALSIHIHSTYLVYIYSFYYY